MIYGPGSGHPVNAYHHNTRNSQARYHLLDNLQAVQAYLSFGQSHIQGVITSVSKPWEALSLKSSGAVFPLTKKWLGYLHDNLTMKDRNNERHWQNGQQGFTEQETWLLRVLLGAREMTWPPGRVLEDGVWQGYDRLKVPLSRQVKLLWWVSNAAGSEGNSGWCSGLWKGLATQ